MASAQVQLPDDLFERAQRFSAEHDLTLEETLRRALDLLVGSEPDQRARDEEWKLPVFDAGGILVPVEKLRDLIFEDEADRHLHPE